MSRTIAITGASGLIGGALSCELRKRGDTVRALVRRDPRAEHEFRWDPQAGTIDEQVLDGLDVVINLAGAGVGEHRWNTEHKTEILRSRVGATRTISTAIRERGAEIRLVNGSAVGFYGDRGEECLSEESPAGTGFLAEVVRAWEGAAEPLASIGGNVAFTRFGLVMAGSGGALAPLLKATKFGLGGPLGSGRQFWPIISLRDTVAALIHLIEHPEVTGPVNLVGVDPPRQRQVAAELGRLLHRPSILPAPRLGLRLVVGQFADEILASQRVLPEVLRNSGFAHRDTTVHGVLASALGVR